MPTNVDKTIEFDVYYHPGLLVRSGPVNGFSQNEKKTLPIDSGMIVF